MIPNKDPTDTENKYLPQRQKYTKRCDKVAWNWYKSEDLTLLYNLCYKKEPEVKVGGAVVTKDDEQNKVQWKLAVITKVYPRRDSKVTVIRLRARK